MAARTTRKAAAAATVEAPEAEVIETPTPEQVEADQANTDALSAAEDAAIEEAPEESDTEPEEAPVVRLTRKQRVEQETSMIRSQVEWVVQGKSKVLHLSDCPHYTRPVEWVEATTSQASTFKVCTDCGQRALTQIQAKQATEQVSA